MSQTFSQKAVHRVEKKLFLSLLCLSLSREDGSRSQLALRPDNLRWLFEEYNRLAAGEEVDFAGRSQLPSRRALPLARSCGEGRVGGG